MPFFKPKKTFFTSINIKNNIFTYTHLFGIFNQKQPLKMGTQGTNQYIFLWHSKSKLKKKIGNLKSSKIRMPKKMTPKSQAKNETPFT